MIDKLINLILNRKPESEKPQVVELFDVVTRPIINERI